MSSKKENTRILTFKKDYKPGKKVLFKKGEQHAIHKDTVKTIKKNKGEFDEMTYDEFIKDKKSKKK